MRPLDTPEPSCYDAAMLQGLARSRRLVSTLLCVLIVPLVLLPPSAYSMDSQIWWLPAFLAVLSAIALFQLIVRRSQASWPWYLLGFSQGFNILSRLMVLLPRVTVAVDGVERLNAEAVPIYLGTIVLSALGLTYLERTDVRAAMAR